MLTLSYVSLHSLRKLTLKNWNAISLQGPFGMVSSMWSTKFCYLNLLIRITYSIDLNCLGFIVNGGNRQHNWRIPIVWHPQNFLLSFYLR